MRRNKNYKRLVCIDYILQYLDVCLQVYRDSNCGESSIITVIPISLLKLAFIFIRTSHLSPFFLLFCEAEEPLRMLLQQVNRWHDSLRFIIKQHNGCLSVYGLQPTQAVAHSLRGLQPPCVGCVNGCEMRTSILQKTCLPRYHGDTLYITMIQLLFSRYYHINSVLIEKLYR